MKNSVDRRGFLKTGAIASGVVMGVASLARAQQCRLTPPQTEGPFYPVDDPFDKDENLTYVNGKMVKAQGQPIVIHGVVRDQHCTPVVGALVEIWQACNTGKYNHPADNNPASLDPNFQYWGKSVTNSEGKYHFKTIIPGAYPAAPGWDRPPHVHFKVHKKGYLELTTQMYFAGQKLNQEDKILQRLSFSDQAKVIVQFQSDGLEYGELQSGKFDLVIEKV